MERNIAAAIRHHVTFTRYLDGSRCRWISLVWTFSVQAHRRRRGLRGGPQAAHGAVQEREGSAGRRSLRILRLVTVILVQVMSGGGCACPQKFRYTATRQLLHVRSGLCLDAGAGADAGGDARVAPCRPAGAAQRWDLDHSEENGFRGTGQPGLYYSCSEPFIGTRSSNVIGVP